MKLSTLVLVFVSACGSARPVATALVAAATPITAPAPIATPVMHQALARGQMIDARPMIRASLAAHRLTQIARLTEYRDAGAFTTNEIGFPIGVFRDAESRMCAMASLIASSGRVDLVDHVAATNNTLKLADVHDGPLMDWMLGSGMTQEEIAMVQGALDLYTELGESNGANHQLAWRRPRGAARFVKLDTTAAHTTVKQRLTDAIATLNAATNASLDTAVERVHAATPKTTTATR